MAIGNPAISGTAALTTAGTTIGLAPSTVAAGSYGVLLIAKDNSGTTTANSSEVTSVTDTRGNTWVNLGEYRYSAGAANDGSVVSVWTTILTAGLTVSVDEVDAFWTGNAVCAMTLLTGTIASGKVLRNNVTPVTGSVVATAAPGSLTITATDSAVTRFYLRAVGAEGITPTTANLTATAGWIKLTPTIASTGTALTSQTVYGERLLASTAGQTSNPSNAGAARDQVSILLCLEEQSPAAALAATPASVRPPRAP
jgi:hypothetical protein